MTRDFSRQSFLPSYSEKLHTLIKVGIAGLCGGGSHIVQQLAHIGIENYAIADGDRVDASNLNRLVGATQDDVEQKRFKTDIASRVIHGIAPHAKIHRVNDRWQEQQILFRDCAVIFGCVDSYLEREQLERFCRRFLIHYIDVGMDVLQFGESHRIVGQVVMSSPGWPCLRCSGIITDENLKQEAQRYGRAGTRPQVVWPNGVLASTAIGLFMQLVNPWHGGSTGFAYREYNGNDHTILESPRSRYAILHQCDHFHTRDLGDPFFNLSR